MFEPLSLAAPLIFFALNVLTPGPNVLNTIGTALGSGRTAAYGCAAACAVGVLGWAAAALLGAGALFAAVPELRDGLTAIGALVLIYFAYRYLRRALGRSDAVQRIDGVTPRGAFSQALLVLATNPKALTTWIALLSIFPQISVSWVSMAAFGLGCAAVAGGGHAVYATVFSTSHAARIYAKASRPVNGLVGVGFTIYAVKLLAGVAGY